jgi:ceramide glucosyltransferase
MAQAATHDLWVVSDSDVQVGRDYLRRLVAPFAEERVGCVSCLYRGVGQAGVWSRLEAAAMSIEMSSGVVVANMMEPMQFALGPTMAARRACVQEIGGFESLADFCADDFVLGNRIAAHGHTVALSSYTIDHIVLHAGFVDSIKHQVRWMKSTRFSRPKGHFGTGLTFATPFGLLVFATALLLHRPWLGVAALAWSVVGRMLQAWVVGKFVVEERSLWLTELLFPIRDLMGFIFWTLSYSSNRILWRGEIYELLDEGRMRKAK